MLKAKPVLCDHQSACRFTMSSRKRTLAVVLAILLLVGHLTAVPIAETILPVRSAEAAGLAASMSLNAAAAGVNPFANADEARRGRQASMRAPSGKAGGLTGANPPGGTGKPDPAQPAMKRYLVRFRADCPAADMAAALAGESYKIVGFSKNRLVRLVSDDLAAFRKKAVGLLDEVEEEVVRKADRTVNDPLASQQWALAKLNMGQAWDITTGSNSFYVAILDTGIDRSHPDLDQADIRLGWDYIYGDSVMFDGDGHGTAVTSIIAAETNNFAFMAGVCWNAAIIPLKVLDADGSGTSGDVVEAIYDAADVGCKVINMSLGSAQYSSMEYNAVQYALSRGCIVIASAGNDGASILNYPASYNGVISVASTNSANAHSAFSNYNSSVDLCAPGENILVSIPYSLYGAYYGFGGGTSFSAPYVSGIAALAVSVNPGLTGDTFLTQARLTSLDLGQPGYDVYFGHGLIDAGKLLSSMAQPIRFTVTFESNGGSMVAPVNADSGAKIAAPATPARTGHTFAGWFKDPALTDDWDFANDVVTDNMILYAKWTVNRYTVTFNCNGGSSVAPVLADFGTMIAAPSDPVKDGSAFAGWYKDAALTDDWVFASDTVAADTMLFAKWRDVLNETKVRAFVTRFYTLFFNREPDQTGLDHWTNGLLSKEMTGAYVSAFFVDSPEFKAMNVADATYLDMMYRAFFDREPDAEGKAHWQSYLDNGMSRYWVLYHFVSSDEFQRLCTEFGIERGSMMLTAPADLYPKITAFVTRFYKLTLERNPDEEGLNYWVKDLADGKRTGAMLANDFIFSPEFIARNTANDQFVTIMYRAFFGREPDTGGMGYWLNELVSGSKTRLQVLAGFVYSDEFQGICDDYGIVRGNMPS